jgi:V/A-type H+-transporting ATPase subunit A
MREISSRLEEMPGEEGYPAYLATRLAQFYERAGRVQTLGDELEGSITVIGAVSPPGGDFSEPVTQNTLRVAKSFWALDAKLAQKRHFPSINWLQSYSLYKETLEAWFTEHVGKGYVSMSQEFMSILQEEDKLLQIVQLVGSDSLPEKQQLTLEVARVIREFFLQQNAFHDVDAFSDPKKTGAIMEVILKYRDLGQQALSDGIRVAKVLEVRAKNGIAEARYQEDYQKVLDEVHTALEAEFAALR